MGATLQPGRWSQPCRQRRATLSRAARQLRQRQASSCIHCNGPGCTDHQDQASGQLPVCYMVRLRPEPAAGKAVPGAGAKRFRVNLDAHPMGRMGGDVMPSFGAIGGARGLGVAGAPRQAQKRAADHGRPG